jgi:DNA-directed RNA polymerase sigma subunit (sigma70/sigma32)
MAPNNKQERNNEIIKKRRTGQTLESIAKEYGIRKQRVWKIVEKDPECRKFKYANRRYH